MGFSEELAAAMAAQVEVHKRYADPNFQQDDVAPGGINVVNKTKFVLEFPRFVWTDDEDEIDDIMLALQRLGVPDTLTWFKPDDETTDAIMIAENIRRPVEFVFCIYEATSAGHDAMRAMLEPYERTTVSMTRKECSEAYDALARIMSDPDDWAKDDEVVPRTLLILENLLQRLGDCD